MKQDLITNPSDLPKTDHALIIEREAFYDEIEELLDDKQFFLQEVSRGLFFGKYNSKNVAIVFAAYSPQIAIKIEHLARDLKIKKLIRVGTCGGLQHNQNVGDIVVCTDAVRNEGTSLAYITKIFPATADFSLTKCICKNLSDRKIKYHLGTIWTNDARFVEKDEDINVFNKLGVLGVDMETSCVFIVSRYKGIQAACLDVISDLPINEIGHGIKGNKTWEEFETKVLPRIKTAIYVALDSLFSQSI